MHRLDDAIARWVCETAGARTVLGAEVVQTLWSGYGSIVRCRLDGASARAVIVKHVRWPSTAEHPRGWSSTRSHARKVRSYEVEVAWYTEHAQRCGQACRVPRCLGATATDDGVLLALEDLDEAGYGRRGSLDEVDLYGCLTWLARFHAEFLGSEPEALWPEGTYWHLQTRPDEWEALPGGALKDAAEALAHQLREAPFPTFVHGDAKLANFCFGAPGEVAAVDFQYVGGGCGMKDVAYFISSCVSERDADARVPGMLDHYFAQLRAAVRGVDADALEASWRALYPVAWTDFYRFLQGWSPGHPKIHRYSERLAREVLGAL
ncbi:MAG: phosphotransferase [Nannocystaceae bacterium]|nr:ecdysteroid 22-kinase family protein [bacterium]